MGRFTHKDVEAERPKPVGSLFMHLLDRDSIMPRPHCVPSARKRYNRSLEGVAFSKYKINESPKKLKHTFGELYANDGTPLRGRRRYPHREESFFNLSTGKQEKISRVKRRTISSMERDHLGQDLLPLTNSPRIVRQRRFVASPTRTLSSHASSKFSIMQQNGALVSECSSNVSQNNTTLTPSKSRVHDKCLQTNNPSLSQNKTIEEAKICTKANTHSSNNNYANKRLTRRTSNCSSDHLQLSSLIPSEYSPKRRSFTPPQFIVRPRHHGIKLFPPRRSLSVDDIKHGVKRVHPLPHWRPVNDQQSDFLHIGVDCVPPTRKPYARSQSTNNLCTNTGQNIHNRKGCKQEYLSGVPRWRGRSKSCNPPRRDFDIITNLPICH